MARSLLIYDGGNPVFRGGARLATAGMADLRVVPWRREAVQAFLRAQFGEAPFAFVLVEDGSVHVGAETVCRVLRRRGIKGRPAAVLTRLYPRIAGPVGRLLHGRPPADLHGTFALDADARTHLQSLLEDGRATETD